MAPLPEQLTGAATYRALFRKLVDAATDGRRMIDTPEGPQPALTNGEAIRVLYGWRYAASRSKRAWRGWYALALPALGWFKEGQRFKVDAPHKAAPYVELPALWRELAQLASVLDEAGVRVGPLYLPKAHDKYMEIARVAWEVMKRGGAPAAIDAVDAGEIEPGPATTPEPDSSPIGPIPPMPKPMPTPTLPDKPLPVPTPPVLRPPSGKGLGLLAILGLVVLASGQRKRKTR